MTQCYAASHFSGWRPLIASLCHLVGIAGFRQLLMLAHRLKANGIIIAIISPVRAQPRHEPGPTLNSHLLPTLDLYNKGTTSVGRLVCI